MRVFQWIVAAALVGLVIVGLPVVQAQQGAPQQPAVPIGERVGQRVDNAINRLEQGAATAQATVQQGFASAGQSR